MTDEKEIDLEELLVQVRRIEAHREKGAETQIQRVYKDLLKNLQGFVGEYYTKYADKNDSLSYEILQQKGKFARFIEEVEQRVNGITPQTKKVIEKTVTDTYKACYQGMERAVKEADTPALRKAVKALTSVDAESVKRAVENPISGLTLKDTLEKNRKDIIYDIKRNIGVGLMNGDRYSSMARRISESLDGDYVKSIRIVRTECKRSDERGKLDFYLQLDKKLQDGNTGKRVKKTWHTKKDERVRPKRGISKGKSKNGANHERMEGVTLLVDELFDLGRAKTLCPGNSGDASNDINCRCRLSYSIVELENTPESDIIKAGDNAVADLNLDPQPITDESIANVPNIKSTLLNPEQNKKLQQAHKELLQLVQNDEPGIEAIAYYSLSMGLLDRHKGVIGMVKQTEGINEPHIAMHNHPSGETFTHMDVKIFLQDPNIKIFTAVSNSTGKIYVLEKTEDFNVSGVSRLYQALQAKYPEYLENLETYEKFMNELLKGVEGYGFTYYVK